MYILTLMFKPGIKVERVGPQEIKLFTLQSQAGSAVLGSHLGDVFLTSSNQSVVEIPESSWTLCPETRLPLSVEMLFLTPAPPLPPKPSTACDIKHRC